MSMDQRKSCLGYLPWCALHCSIALAAVAISWAWLSDAPPAETASVNPASEPWWLLEPPAHFALASQTDDQTAFREDESGFSAYHRAPERTGEGNGASSSPRITVATVALTLLNGPDESNSVRSGPGHRVDLGSNFAIIEIPMVAAVGYGNLLVPREVTVYFDDRGWVVAYLPAGEPAAGIWRHDTGDGANGSDRTATERLEQNLLVLAINEVLEAASEDNPGLSPVTHREVGYYDWQNPGCNAFLLFSNETPGGASEPINFVIPPAIADVQASAAVLVTSEYSTPAPGVMAEVSIDGEPVATADASSLLTASAFDIERPPAEDSGYETSLHEMSVSVTEGETATGVVMLLYDKPGS